MIFEKQVLGMYRGMAYTRCDDAGLAYYFSAKDFPGLSATPYPFTASAGHALQGYIYHYEGYDPSQLIIFDHGFFGGHRSYMKEIEMLCRHGYRVFAYDHTGCMESGGETPNGMAQSLCDLNDCLNQIKSDAQFDGLDLSVMGHSWGGFSTLNISALHPEISHVVVMSGFVSVETLVNSFFAGLLKGYRRAVMDLERASNPKFVDFHAVDSLAASTAKVLLIYSENDQMCRKHPHFDLLKVGLSDKENIRFLQVPDKGHNPNYTTDAVQYLAQYTKMQRKMLRKGLLSTPEQRAAFVASFDWNRMTAQDETVWKEIFAALDA